MQEERIMIARMIEERKITAEQGLALLDALTRSEDEAVQPAEAVEAAPSTSGMQDGQAFWESKWPAFPTEYVEFKVDNASITYRVWDRDYTQIHVSATSGRARGGFDLQRWLEETIKQSHDEDRYKFSLLTEGAEKHQIEAEVTITAPQGQAYEMFRLEAENGNIDVGQLYAETSAFSTTNGNLALESVTCETVKATSVNGNVSVNGMTAEEASLLTTNGEISASGGKYEDLNCQTMNGNVHLHDVSAEDINSTTVNGNIHTNSRFEDLSCRTQNGNISIHLPEGSEESDVKAETQNGNVEIRLPDEIAGVYGELRTVHGAVYCSLNGRRHVDMHAEGQPLSVAFRQDEEELVHVKASSHNGSVHVSDGK
ncbi:DUF4097 family beta strand repeat-containing protein [Paenibacillus silvisoli]|uniref:DUF4097 family beta strand repeat-containing protein n=1 Tax=Paenibacillus silvisoli TaxID=3110539 RepID=UPI0028063A39|nr:DUF4097 family beta strand repeat-containing protein [Paenibacillus silvisoli]